MLVNQIIVTLFLGIGYLSFPSSFLHDFPGPENGFFKAIMTVDTGRVFDQVWIADIPPPTTITDTWNIPGGVINLCKASKDHGSEKFQLQSGSFETLIKLSNEGMGMTLLPYLHTLDIPADQVNKLHYFNEPSPAREVSVIYSKSELKMQIINALYDVISGVIRGAIAFQDVKIISPMK